MSLAIHTNPGIPLGQPTAAEQKAKFHKAATAFEGILINTLWSEMQNDPLADNDDSDAGGGTMRGMGLQAMSSALASSGGLGLAKMMEAQLEPSLADPSPAGPANGAGTSGSSAAPGTVGGAAAQDNNSLKIALPRADSVSRTENLQYGRPMTQELHHEDNKQL